MKAMDQRAAAVTGSPEGLRIPLAFEEFYETERERLFRALLLVTHDSAEAEDLMQEAFVRMWSVGTASARSTNLSTPVQDGVEPAPLGAPAGPGRDQAVAPAAGRARPVREGDGP